MFKLYIGMAAAFLALFLPYPVQAQEGEKPAFLQALNDIPLMPGLYEMLEEEVVFDQPGGRIVSAEAVAENAQASEIKSFYSRILPQLGWEPVGPDSFTRAGEVLRIAIQESDSVQTVHFTVEPRP